MNVFDYLFEHSKTQEKDFLLGNRETLSYPQLFRDSLDLAHAIRALHGENNHILLIAPNSVFFLVTYLAIIKSGNICVPLNPETEARNLDYIITLCEAKIAFISPILSGREWPDLEHIHDLNLSHGQISPKAEQNGMYSEPFDDDRLAEVIFTSGSTGQPKGVMISHRNIAANTQSIVSYLLLSESDIIEVVMPFYYCYGLSLLHTHLRVGGSMVLNNSFILIGSVIKDLLSYKCTGFAGVPSHFQILLRKSKTFISAEFPDLRYMTQAGGRLHNVFLEEYVRIFPQIDFFVMYGQTEATARLSYLPPGMLQKKIGSIGKAIPGVHLDVVDEAGLSVSEPGKIGELVASGDNIMKGYLGDAKASSEVLKNNSLLTGDLAYRDEEGYFYLTARKKEILKVSGNRVSPKEIEEVIVSIPDVVDCSVSGVFDDVQGEAIKATIILKDLNSGDITTESIQAYCGKHLAQFKIPGIIEFESRMDIAPTGKKVKKDPGKV